MCPAENKEGQVRSEDFGKDIVSVQALLTKQVSYPVRSSDLTVRGRDKMG